MSRGYIIAGTDTDVGKTVFAAGLVAMLEGCYWKPVQAGTDDGGDRATVARLSRLAAHRLLPEAYRLTRPLSPHRTAELDGVEIDPTKLVLPSSGRPLVIELAGGLMVPLTRRFLQVELLAGWGLPVVLVARTALGTINHSLLSIEALRRRVLPIHGIAFMGDANDDNERTICDIGQVRWLGRLPRLDPLDAHSLSAAFAANFRREDFA